MFVATDDKKCGASSGPVYGVQRKSAGRRGSRARLAQWLGPRLGTERYPVRFPPESLFWALARHLTAQNRDSGPKVGRWARDHRHVQNLYSGRWHAISQPKIEILDQRSAAGRGTTGTSRISILGAGTPSHSPKQRFWTKGRPPGAGPQARPESLCWGLARHLRAQNRYSGPKVGRRA